MVSIIVCILVVAAFTCGFVTGYVVAKGEK